MGGEPLKQPRGARARALAVEPDVVLFDKALSGIARVLSRAAASFSPTPVFDLPTRTVSTTMRRLG